MARRQSAWGHVEHVDDPHLTARRTLLLVGERTRRNVQGRVAVPPSLPLGIERAALVRSGSSGSASGTFRVEWQCDSHCHSVVSVLAGTNSEPAAVTPIGEWPNWANALGQPPAKPQGLRQSPQALAWGLTARKGAVWAEGLADGAPWARPEYHQAASCGLRRCRELRLRVRLVCSHGMSRMGAETYTNRSNQPQS